MKKPLKSWIAAANAEDCDFPIQNLPYGVFSIAGSEPRCGVAIGDMIVDLAACEDQGLIGAKGTFARPQVNDFIALGRPVWSEVRRRLVALLAEDGHRNLPLVAMQQARLHLPIRVSEYTDFYASRNHAYQVGAMFRGPENALPPQWTHMPIGYNGRASSVVVSGSDIRRPMGQVKGAEGPLWTACQKLDLELELACIVGAGNAMGERVSDLLGSGTISGPGRKEAGSLLEMSENGKAPLLVNGHKRTFLEDGDEVGLFAYAQGQNYRIGFGPCLGRILPAME